jgi:hypothetical protein
MQICVTRGELISCTIFFLRKSELQNLDDFVGAALRWSVNLAIVQVALGSAAPPASTREVQYVSFNMQTRCFLAYLSVFYLTSEKVLKSFCGEN